MSPGGVPLAIVLAGRGTTTGAAGEAAALSDAREPRRPAAE